MRCLVAALVLSAFVLGCLEPLAAEAHDGDATPSSAAALGSAVDVGAPAEPAEPAPPTHAAHLCHCTHAHGASALASEVVSVVVLLVDESAPRPSLLAPASVTREGLLRPPAAARG